MNFPDANESAPLISVVVVNYNCKKWLDRFFPALRAQTIFNQLEIILVDNTSTDGSADICRNVIAEWPNGVFLPTGGNYGFGGGCNRGAKAARGKYLFFVNPDVKPKPDCLEELARRADENNLKVACPLILDYDSDNIQNQGSTGFDIFGCVTSPLTPLPPDKVLKPVFAVATFFFIRRDFFQKLDGFDDEFFLYNEELDLSWRTWIAGESVTLIRSAKIHHQFASNEENRTSDAKRFYTNRSLLLTLLQNSQCFLLGLVLSQLALLTAEAAAGALLARRLSFIRWALLKPVADCWRMRRHIVKQRRKINNIRQRGDGWIFCHFFSLRFGRWGDVRRLLKFGVKIDKS
jgi:N-acetylglucosaminyl-diphospho-decaprenol L-rhamnosyltransferase